jgi:hypothetical protein
LPRKLPPALTSQSDSESITWGAKIRLWPEISGYDLKTLTPIAFFSLTFQPEFLHH